jgi:hypothetical protein
MAKTLKVKKKKLTKLDLKLRVKLWTALGSIIIFSSWMTQNFMQEKWHSELVRLERNKLAIGFNEVNKNIYQTYLNSEQSHKATDSSYVDHLNLAFSAYVNYAHLLQYLGVSISKDDKEFLKKNENIFDENLKEIKKWNESGQIDRLSDFAEGLSKWESENGTNTIGAYQSKIAEIREKEEFWNKIYLALYIAGAFCFSLAFMIDYNLTKSEQQ